MTLALQSNLADFVNATHAVDGQVVDSVAFVDESAAACVADGSLLSFRGGGGHSWVVYFKYTCRS